MHAAGSNKTDTDPIALSEKTHWLPLLEAAGVDLILAGHYHVYERSYMLDNLTGTSASITSANKIDTTLGRIDMGGAYHKEPGQPHEGTIFINCAAGGYSSGANNLIRPFSFMPVVYRGSDYEGSLVIDVDGSKRMDVSFLCDEMDSTGSHVWDHFTISKEPEGVSDDGNQNLVPNGFAISNYPNPFNPSTKIQLTIANRQLTIVKVFDVLGREVATLVNEVREKGIHAVQWSGKDERGNDLPSGIYLAQLRAGGSVKNAKMMLLR